MRNLSGLLLLIPTLALAQPDPAYKPLAFLAGYCWQGTFPGGERADEHCFSWIYDGKFLRDRHTLRIKNQPDAQGESIYLWNSSTKQLEYLYIESDGGFARGPVSQDADTLVFADANFVENGKTSVYRSRWQRSTPDAYDVVTEFRVKDTWVPGFTVHMARVAAP